VPFDVLRRIYWPRAGAQRAPFKFNGKIDKIHVKYIE